MDDASLPQYDSLAGMESGLNFDEDDDEALRQKIMSMDTPIDSMDFMESKPKIDPEVIDLRSTDLFHLSDVSIKQLSFDMNRSHAVSILYQNQH